MNRAKISSDDRHVVRASLEKSQQYDVPAAAIELPSGEIVTGRTKDLLGSCAAALLNALKALAGIDDSIHLISPRVIQPICKLKTKTLGSSNPRLHADEILIALSICAATDKNARAALDCLPLLEGCEAHSSVIVSHVDSSTFRKLKMNLTCEPAYETKKLFHH